MGEGYGIYQCGDDKAIMPHITMANVACGFHASDPLVMKKVVRLAKEHNKSQSRVMREDIVAYESVRQKTRKILRFAITPLEIFKVEKY